MAASHPPLRAAGRLAAAGLLLLALGVAPARAIEFLDGRVQVHGYGETQIRGISRNFAEQLDLSQWYLIGNVEIELDIAPDGFGPFDQIGGYIRVEGRYDCVWTHACGLFQSVNTYGDQAKRLPDRLADGHKPGYLGALSPSAVRIDAAGKTLDFTDTRRYIRIPLGQDSSVFAVQGAEGTLARPVPGQNSLGRLWDVPGLGQLFFALPGLDPGGVDGNRDPLADTGAGDDDVSGCFPGNSSPLPCRYAGAYVAQRFFGYRFGVGATRGPTGGTGSTIFGPWRPKDTIVAWGALRDRVNPYDPIDLHPVLVDPVDGTPIHGTGALPFRPAAEYSYAADANRDGVVDANDAVGLGRSRGLYYPSSRLAAALADDAFDTPDVNFDQRDLAFNHGDAQRQTQELKEAYLDLELFDHALWLRAGRQTIVWGKTELFRSQDQFNPQDLGLSSLPSLEESRIPLWALRGIYSFYDVGPLQDVRLEGAVLLDEFQPLDPGRCGEPYAPPQACTLAAALFAHGLVGIGLAGQYLPKAPWEDIRDTEAGVRVEWRWDRLSFALSGWTGFPDVPHVEVLQAYERNVDPRTGRPRRMGATGPCAEGTEPSCFAGGIARDDPNDPNAAIFYPNLARPDVADVRANHHANQQLFAVICASTIGFSDLLPNGCAFDLWNSQQIVQSKTNLGISDPTAAIAFSAMLQGGTLGKLTLATLSRFPTEPLDRPFDLSVDGSKMPLVPLHVNANPPAPAFPNAEIDGGPVNGFRLLAFPDVCGGVDCAPAQWRPSGLDPALSVQQEALIGCGDYWGTDCDVHGFDLMNAEASAIFQSWPGFEGAGGRDWDPFDASVPQPGTIGFRGGPVCTRWDSAARKTLVLPGCRGVRQTMISPTALTAVFDPGYDARVDGCVFAPTVGSLVVVGVYPDGSPVDLHDCTASTRGRTTIPIRTLYHPFAGCLSPADEAAGLTCTFDRPRTQAQLDAAFLNGRAQVFHSEMAALSWNLLMVLVGNSLPPDKLGGGTGPNCDATALPKQSDGCSDRPPRFDEFDVNRPERLDGCSYRRPFLCKAVGPLLLASGARRASVRAGGNGRFGRRDFQWHAGGVGVLKYSRRNILGLSLDFPEDVTKTNWGVEFTWFDRVIMADNNEFDGLTTTREFNLSISVDRPTIIRFLNTDRTFLFNTQVFLQYIDNYKPGMPANGPFNALATFFATTGYHQDRVIPNLTLVHDFASVSGAVIAGLTYRYTTQFSVGVGVAGFYGRVQTAPAALTSLTPGNGGAGPGRDREYVENGLSSIRDRDELFLHFRYTF